MMKELIAIIAKTTLATLLILALNACDKPVPHLDLGEIYTFKGYPYKLALDSGMIVQVNSPLRVTQNDSGFRLLSLDTGHCSLAVYDIHECDTVLTMELRAIAHPLYDPGWENSDAPKEALQGEAAAVYSRWKHMRSSRVKKEFPDFYLRTADGTTIDQSYFQGKVTHVNTWHWGCIPCLAEIPYLNALKSSYEGDPTLQFLAFYRDSISNTPDTTVLYTTPLFKGDTARRAPDIGIKDFEYLQIPLSGEFLKSHGILADPQHFIVGPDGTILYHQVGASWDDNSEHVEILRRHIEAARCIHGL